MRKICLSILTAALAAGASAQELSVTAAGTMTVMPGAGFYFSQLELLPSTAFSLSNQSVRKDTTVTHSFSNPYANRTYPFSSPAVFSGDVMIHYNDGELNGITETSLQLGVYNGTTWQSAGTTTVNVTDDYILTSGISAQPLGELIMTNAIPLPLQWGEVSALRQGVAIRVQWSTLREQDVDHFDVERSTDALHWNKAITGIPARNSSGRSDYSQDDYPGYDGLLYYRIRRSDRNGETALSKVVTVNGNHHSTSVVLSPNPARGHFSISGLEPASIGQVDLLNAAGVPVKTWNGYQPQFALPELPAGLYFLRIRTTGGTIHSQGLSVK